MTRNTVKQAEPAKDPRLQPASAPTDELRHGGAFVDGKLVEATVERSHEDKADRHGKEV